MGIGSAQFFDQNGNPLLTGVLYSYAAGTTTQQATYTDSTGLVQNPDPITFTTGARVSIWITSSLKYKFVLCAQNDGAFCAPADVLFSVDQVPGCPGCTTGSNIFIGTFISGSPNPATTGILELASTDAICWRNQAGTTNLCITKDSSDILSWTGSTIKLAETNCSIAATTYDYICPNAATHHLSLANNNGAYGSISTVATAGVAGHLPSFAANGIDLQDSGATPPAVAIVTFSATPTFASTSQDQLFGMTLTGNVTGSTLTMTSLPVPSIVSFSLLQDGTGGRTFAWPANVMNPPSVTGAAAAPNARTFATFVWDGTFAWNVSQVQIPSFNAPQRVTQGAGAVSLPANTQTIILTESVTFPSTAGTYRADVRYSTYITQGANACITMAIDTTNNRAFAFTAQNANGSGFDAYNGSEISSQTYTAGATATFTLQAICNALSSATQTSGLFTPTPNPVTFLAVTPVLSN